MGDIIFGGTLSKTWHLEVLGFNACVSFGRDNRILVFIIDQILVLIDCLLWMRNWRAERGQVSWGLNSESIFYFFLLLVSRFRYVFLIT